MSTVPELEARLAELEARVNMLDGLGASRDRDLADLGQKVRGIDGLVRAVAKTQGEHTAQLRRLQDRVDRLHQELGLIHATQTMQTGLLNEIINLLTPES